VGHGDCETYDIIDSAHTLLKGHSTAVNCFGINPEELSKLPSGSYDTTVKLWDIRLKDNYGSLKGHSKPITSISISPDGNMLLSGSEDNSARLWDLRQAEKPLYIASEHTGPILKVRFNPEDCMFATCSMDKTAKFFRCEEKCYGFTSSTEMVATPVTAISFSDDGKVLYTAANDVLKSWNMYKNGLLLETFDASWKGVQDIAMVKGALMGIASSAGSLSLWVCDVQRKIKNSSQVSEEGSLVLPRIGKGRFGDDNQINELQNIVGLAIQRVNTIEERPVRDKEKDNERRSEEMERKKAEMERRREEMERRK
jgi:WD40 repeat protein